MYRRILWVCLIAVVATALFIAPVSAQPIPVVWHGDYFDNQYLIGEPVISRTDENLIFSWGTGSPADGVPVDYFSVRWGTDVELTAGTYRISSWADDEIQVIFDFQDTPLIDTFNQALAGQRLWATFTVPVDGTYHIQVDYRERLDNAYAEVFLENVTGTILAPEATVLPTSDVTASILAARLNVRDEPSIATGEIITHVNRGESYPVLGANADSSWYLVDIGATQGWVSANFVELTPADADVPVISADETQDTTEATAVPEVTPEATAESGV